LSTFSALHEFFGYKNNDFYGNVRDASVCHWRDGGETTIHRFMRNAELKEQKKLGLDVKLA
jgi:hypothetical protein